MFFVICVLYVLWDVFLYVFSSFSTTGDFVLSQCSYSSRASRCWCTLEHNEEELRTVHTVYLCVTSIAGNATSKTLDFTPLGIRKWVCPHVWFAGQNLGAEIGYSLPNYCRVLIAASVSKETFVMSRQSRRTWDCKCSLAGCHKISPHDLIRSHYFFLLLQWSPTRRRTCQCDRRRDTRRRWASPGISQPPGSLTTTFMNWSMRSNTDLSCPRWTRNRCVLGGKRLGIHVPNRVCIYMGGHSLHSSVALCVFCPPSLMTVWCVFTRWTVCLSVCLLMQIQRIKRERSYHITDAMPGVEYVIQVRTKEEYDGLWSDWSTPVCASSWTGKQTCTSHIHMQTHTHVATLVLVHL